LNNNNGHLVHRLFKYFEEFGTIFWRGTVSFYLKTYAENEMPITNIEPTAEIEDIQIATRSSKLITRVK
jgi:hypothetical protein